MRYYRSSNNGNIVCNLCAHHCTLQEGKTGVCGINQNENGKLKNLVYGYPSALHLDPIEKKPLYHFLPATNSLSLGTVGCNFRCPFCQNHTISQNNEIRKEEYLSPEAVIKLAVAHGARSISYTYNEPTVFYPYARDIAVLAHEAGLKNIFVTSGFESHEVREDMVGLIDAVNVDLKSFNAKYYKTVLKTSLEKVLENLRFFSESTMHLEITTLVIEGVNDGDDELAAMARFIAEELAGTSIYHLSAFYPAYKMDTHRATRPQRLFQAKEIAKKAGIDFVYLGNIAADNTTYCPRCGNPLIERNGYDTRVLQTRCSCGYTLQGVFDD